MEGDHGGKLRCASAKFSDTFARANFRERNYGVERHIIFGVLKIIAGSSAR
jgi:hypothetical protein